MVSIYIDIYSIFHVTGVTELPRKLALYESHD